MSVKGGAAAAAALAALVAACAAQPDDGGRSCMGGKCDVPDDPPEQLCSLRRSDAYNPNQYAFTERALRWSCDDARGVTDEDRGQEYCEYFAVVRLAADAAPRVLGRNLGADSSYGATPAGVTLSETEVSALEYDDAEVVGQCVFTSWQQDYAAPLACGDQCGDVWGVPLAAEDFRMKFDVNSIDAAQMLVQDCYVTPTGGDTANQSDALNDDFTRGCMLNESINQTSFRKSDTTVCAASMRMAECGCAVPGADLPVAVSPWQRRGFPLGTWSDAGALPPGCRYVQDGEQSHTLVACDLTAADVLAGAADVKERCRTKYAPNVVVHVAIPDGLSCTPPAGGKYAGSCTAEPWVLGG